MNNVDRTAKFVHKLRHFSIERDEIKNAWRVNGELTLHPVSAVTKELHAAANAVENLSMELDRERSKVCATVQYDLSPAGTESATRDKLIELGWTPPSGE